ncbi:hypothetical protein [Chryseobacterium kwangjuense]|uniref:Uncharacterized protein n=1 Tax=Chryseobacterium kwangjuense TaxID=267125 RepID=A0A135W037_9FLAO|nr:hypothetical protein [Chryseobacterium kwangjuense]KXH78290.1 hypothetical protein AU378_22490 [Chryseobacterium kwangjuense]
MNYRYFIQEGNRFHLKTSMPVAMIRFIACLVIAAALYFIIPQEKKIGLWGAGLFVVFGLINLLRTTKKLVIDPYARVIKHKNNILNGEVEYRFDEFEQFYVLVTKYVFIPMDSTAFFIFNKNGKEKRVPIIVGLFGSQKVQKAINEVSDIMNIAEK